MQKVKISERVPAKVWAILFCILLAVVVALIFIFVPGAWDGFAGLLVTGFNAFLGLVVWVFSDIRFIIGLAIPSVIFAVYATRKYWHKETAVIVPSPVASTAPKLTDVPGGELFDKKVESAE